jgi:hypothetical protein
MSPFVCDVEWLSVDDIPDPRAEERITVLGTVVLQTLKLLVPEGFGTKEASEIQVEYLGRKPAGKKQFKNSYHMVVPGAVFEHNAKGCMKDFVLKMLMPEIEKNKEMLWISKTDPKICILDKSIYSRGRQLRMPGCCKYGGVGLPLASPDELHRMRTSYYVPEMPVGTQIITEAMVAKLCVPTPLVSRNNKKKKNMKRNREAASSLCEEEQKGETTPDQPLRPNKKERREEATTIDKNMLAKVEAMLRFRGDRNSHVTPSGEYGQYRVTIASETDRVCGCDPTGVTIHQNNGAKITVKESTGEVWLYCFSSRCPDAVCMGYLDRTQEKQDEVMRTLDDKNNCTSTISSSSTSSEEVTNNIMNDIEDVVVIATSKANTLIEVKDVEMSPQQDENHLKKKKKKKKKNKEDNLSLS